jgi:hypothetical protein
MEPPFQRSDLILDLAAGRANRSRLARTTRPRGLPTRFLAPPVRRRGAALEVVVDRVVCIVYTDV